MAISHKLPMHWIQTWIPGSQEAQKKAEYKPLNWEGEKQGRKIGSHLRASLDLPHPKYSQHSLGARIG